MAKIMDAICTGPKNPHFITFSPIFQQKNLLNFTVFQQKVKLLKEKLRLWENFSSLCGRLLV
jgi:hypothetical protein